MRPLNGKKRVKGRQVSIVRKDGNGVVHRQESNLKKKINRLV